MPYTLEFRNPSATRLDLSGGKGANLALLTQRDFPVPPGFVVTAAAYRDFIASAGEILARVPGLPFDDPQALRSAADQLRHELSGLTLPDAVAAEIRARLAELPARAFSVRSSSTMEDLAGAAFAGQHETYLNCVGENRILERVRDCYLSLWADRAIAYRHRQGFDHALATMAVVVQEMIPCEAAGVAFSVNPVSGALDEIVINANFGLGESVVSGEGEIDQFILDKASGAIRQRRIAAKTRRIVAAQEGTHELELAAEDATRPALSEEQLGELAGLLRRVEESYGFPQDIEWGFAGGRLYLLQSRPVTTIPPRWTRDESAERFPRVVTPLTWDFVEAGFHRSLAYSFRLMGLPPFEGKWFGMHGHYIYGNQNAVEIYGRRSPFAPRDLDELRQAIPALRERFAWVLELPAAWERDLDHYLLRIGELMSEPLENQTLAGLWEHVRAVNEHGAGYFLPNIAISLTHGMLYRLLHHLLRLAVGAGEADAWFDRLLAYCETKTGQINRELLELARLIRSTPALEALVRGRPSRELLADGALDSFPEYNVRFHRFLRDHGHREIDFDACAPTWIEAPWVVLDSIRLMLDQPDEAPAHDAHAARRAQQQAEHELWQRLPEDLRYFYSEIIRLARLYTSLDDLEHYQTTRLTLPLRRGLRELGSRLVERGVLEEPMDVFFARVEQLETAIRDDSAEGWGNLAAQVRAQKSAYLADRERTPAWNLDAPTEPVTDDNDGRALGGLAGSAGVAEGAAFLVLDSEDFARFPKGAVLVARTTNPTWTPLFYRAVAVITESGGPLSHGAVTAREMRIPAVMSVRGVLARLKNGDRVRVDGTRGQVQVLD